MQPDVMFPNDPVESREQMLRDNCDQIEQRSFTRSFSQDEVYARRAELEQVSIQVAELEDELAQIRADVYRQEVESNLPKSFTVKIPIFAGPVKTTFDVEFDHYLTDDEVFLQLVSPGAQELMDEWRDNSIDKVLNSIRELAPDIAILEA